MTPSLDVRLPIGVLCAMIGALLVGYGLSPHSGGGGSLAIDVWWGAVMLAVGVLMLAGAWWHARRDRGRRVTERQNHFTGEGS